MGNLKISQSLVNPMLGGGSSLSGEDDEKIHYKEIRDIYWKIKELNEYRQYLGDLDSYKMVKFSSILRYTSAISGVMPK